MGVHVEVPDGYERATGSMSTSSPCCRDQRGPKQRLRLWSSGSALQIKHVGWLVLGVPQEGHEQARCALQLGSAKSDGSRIHFHVSAEPGRRGFQDWLAGKKDVSAVVVAAFAYSLSAKLRGVKHLAGVTLPDLVAAHSYGIWNKLLTYQDFEPLPALVAAACGPKVARVAARTVMADLAEHAVQDAGSMPALAFSGGLCMLEVGLRMPAGPQAQRTRGSRVCPSVRVGAPVFGFGQALQKLLLTIRKWTSLLRTLKC